MQKYLLHEEEGKSRFAREGKVTNPLFGGKIMVNLGRNSGTIDFVPRNSGQKGQEMNTELRIAPGLWPQLKYAVLMPLFFFSFCFVYDPFSFQEVFTVGGKSFTFHLLMLTLILGGVLSVTRTAFALSSKRLTFLWWQYVVWCIAEILAISAFFSMYTSLFYKSHAPMPFFTALPICFKLVSMVLLYPYLFGAMLRIITNKANDLVKDKIWTDDSLVKFYDEHNRLKLTIAASAIVFVGAEANYVSIHYIENSRERTFLLRNSMKSIEAGAAGRILVRCHRSYFVNPSHIKVLSRDKDGIIYTEFIDEGVGRVPVSKMYYDNLANLL